MSSAVFYPGLYPGSNASGTNIALPYAPGSTSDASLGGNVNPFMPTSIGTGTSISRFPLGAVSTSATTGFPADFGGYSPTVPGGGAGVVAPANNPKSGAVGITGTAAGWGLPTTVQGQHQLWSGLNKTYGSGMATALMNFLAGGAGFNQDAINNLIAAMQPGFERSQQQLLTEFSAGGNRFGSGAQIGLADLMGQEQLNIGALETQMYEQSLQDYLNVLMGTADTGAKRISGSPGGGDLLSSIMKGVGTAISMIPK